MPKANDLAGKRFGRLTVVSRAANNHRGQTMWNCVCDCGIEKAVLGYNLTKGLTKSCGCYHQDRLIADKTTHGDSHSRLHSIWTNMKTRCTNQNTRSYKDYGGRGITVCDEWANDYSTFKAWALKSGYEDKLTIERIDNNKGYFPQNCCWVTHSEQATNKRNLRKLTYNGETHSLAEWGRITGLGASTIRARIDRRGWTIQAALSTKKAVPNV